MRDSFNIYTLKENLLHLFAYVSLVIITLLWVLFIFWVIKHTWPIVFAIACAFIVVETFKKIKNKY